MGQERRERRVVRREGREGIGMVGTQGRVTGTVGPGLVGEVMVAVRGGSEAFLAYAVEPGERIESGTPVVVVDYQPPRTVWVARAFG
jgi:hypothetical protein